MLKVLLIVLGVLLGLYLLFHLILALVGFSLFFFFWPLLLL